MKLKAVYTFPFQSKRESFHKGQPENTAGDRYKICVRVFLRELVMRAGTRVCVQCRIRARVRGLEQLGGGGGT